MQKSIGAWRILQGIEWMQGGRCNMSRLTLMVLRLRAAVLHASPVTASIIIQAAAGWIAVPSHTQVTIQPTRTITWLRDGLKEKLH